ncbi:MAG: phasin family protein [Hyphomicrobiaceae bacterium]|nr:phasin family protein [Hyphomicrobiaceae bacterium]
MTETPSFEIPGPVRDLAEKNVEQARQAYSQFMDMARKAQDMMARSSGAMADSAREVQGKAMRYAQDNLDASFSFATELARARDLNEAMEIQSRYAQRQMRTYAEQAQDLGRLMADAAQRMQGR